mgnify:CR=1 FL=1
MSAVIQEPRAYPGVSEAGRGRPMNKTAIEDARQYRRMFVLCFSVFLVVALVSRLLPRRMRPLQGTGERRSVIAEARAAANAAVPFVFMA